MVHTPYLWYVMGKNRVVPNSYLLRKCICTAWEIFEEYFISQNLDISIDLRINAKVHFKLSGF